MSFSPTSSPLVMGALGDAYGFCFEFAPPEHVAEHNDLQFHPPHDRDFAPGSYSDDTQMQLALAELIASEAEWSEASIADAFVRTFKRDPRPGYARRFAALLREIEDGAELRARIAPRSERNGAAMRAPILGWFSDVDELLRRAEIQAKVTHDTVGGVGSACASALMTHYFAYELGPKDGLAAFLARHVPGSWEEPWDGPVPVHGIKTVRAAVTAILSGSTLAEVLRRCVSFTGDVDSVATIALAAASGCPELEDDIPARLWAGLERSTYGYDYLCDVEERVSRALGCYNVTRA